MKTNTLSCLLAAVASAAQVLAGGVQIANGDMKIPQLAFYATEIAVPDVVQEDRNPLE